jgi:hypothetical protein
MLKNRLLAVAAIAALGVAGCGGGGDSNKALSYSDFGKKADEICKTENAKIKATSAKLTGNPKTDAVVYDELVPQLEAATKKISGLAAPDELKSTYDQFKAVSQKQVEGAKAAQTAAKSGDAAAYRASLESLRPLGAQSDALASKLGAAECTK